MKRIVVLGAAESGVGAAVLAKKEGFDVFVSDMSKIKDKYKQMLDERGISWEEGQHTEELILNASEIVKSPGIPETAPMVAKAIQAGIPIISEIEFAGRYTTSKMICITGSNGKTTTTSLIYHIFKAAGYDAGLAGNIGHSLALQVAEEPHEYYIIELSSFQLDNMYDFRADIAVLLNITPDHLDRYDFKMQNYVDSKMRILQNQTQDDAFIYWADDPIISRELKKYDIKAVQCPFSLVKKAGVIGYIEEGQYKLEYPIPFNMEQEELSLTGTPNVYNSLAAGLAANIAGIKQEIIRKSLALQVAETPHAYYIIELSSFQLDNMYDFRANIAILLNITPDHLDRYNFEMQNYVDAKMRILQNQTKDDAFIYWNDDPIIQRELKKYNIQAIQYPFSELREKGSIGYIEEGKYMLEKPEPFNMEQEQLSLTGRHNIYNSLAAGLASNIAGIKKEVIRKSLSDFPGVEHRLEKVATVRGVHYVNDSKATNVDACWYALDSMKTKVVLIVGGKDKGNDYEPIKPLIREKCSAIVYLGADNKKLHDNFDQIGIPVRDTHSMKECVEACYDLAQPGETVLLSPCCASFDLFKNMEDRGEQFKELVRNL